MNKGLFGAYNKNCIVKGLENALNRIEREAKEISKLFFVDQKWKRKQEDDISTI